MKVQVFARSETYGRQVTTRQIGHCREGPILTCMERVQSEEVVIASGKEAIVLMSTSGGSAN
jgi:hypothetical protein